MSIPSFIELDPVAGDNTPQIQAALDTGKNVVLNVGTFGCSTGPIKLRVSGQVLSGANRRSSILSLTYTGGPQIVVGKDDPTQQVADVSIRSLNIASNIPGVVCCQMRYARGLRFFDCYITADQFMALGDDTLETTQPAYIFEMYDGCEMHQVAAAQRHFFQAFNFAGQFILIEPQLEGTNVGGVHGFVSKLNKQPRIDDFQIIGGNFTRFDVGLNFEDGRVVNMRLIGCFIDNATTNSVRFNNTSSTTPPLANIGFEGVTISDCRLDASEGPALYIGNHRAENGQNRQSAMTLSNNIITGATQATTPIVIENLVPDNAQIFDINIDGLVGLFRPIDASQDVIRVSCATSVNNPIGAIADITIDGINFEAIGTAARSVVRFKGPFFLRTYHGPNINGRNASKRVDDQTGVACRAGWYYGKATNNFGSIAAGGSASTSVAVPGAKVGDHVQVSILTAPTALLYSGRVVTADAVTVTAANVTAAAISAGSVDLLVRVKPADL